MDIQRPQNFSNQPPQPAPPATSQTPGPKPPAVSLWLVIVFLIVLLGTGGYFAWYYLKGPGKKPVPSTSAPLVTENISPSPTTTNPTTTTSTSNTPAPAANLTYINDKYGFSLTFPATWKDYKFKEATISGTTATYYVEIPTTDADVGKASSTNDAGYYSPFAISVYTLAQWATVESSDGPHDVLITKNTTYAFGWSQANGIPPSDFTQEMQNQIKTIITSFKLTQ